MDANYSTEALLTGLGDWTLLGTKRKEVKTVFSVRNPMSPRNKQRHVNRDSQVNVTSMMM